MGQNMSLADINALATLGGQQQTIAQNQQLFPLTTLSNLASLLQGYSIPTGTKTTMCMSPLSGILAGAALAPFDGLFISVPCYSNIATGQSKSGVPNPSGPVDDQLSTTARLVATTKFNTVLLSFLISVVVN